MIDSDKVKQIRQALEQFWDEQSLSVDSSSTSIDDLVAAMDSLTAVEALINVEKIVGIELPSGELIRRGGYDSATQFVAHLTDRVCKYVEEREK